MLGRALLLRPLQLGGSDDYETFTFGCQGLYDSGGGRKS